MTLTLTPKQERVWRYIASCGRSPTYDEMARDLGYKGRGQLNLTILALKERGYVKYVPRRPRSLVALNPLRDLSIYSTPELEAELARRLAE